MTFGPHIDITPDPFKGFLGTMKPSGHATDGLLMTKAADILYEALTTDPIKPTTEEEVWAYEVRASRISFAFEIWAKAMENREP